MEKRKSRGRTAENIQLFNEGKKFCNFCKNIKLLDDFFNNKSTVDGLSPYCKECCVINNNLQYQKNRKTYTCGACKIPIIWGKFCSLHYIEYKKEYRKIYERERRLDCEYKIKNNISRSIRFALFTNNLNKKDWKTVKKYLPYTIQELKDHLENLFEPWMNWKNYGKYDKKTWDDNDDTTKTWQIDHKIAHSTFHYTSMEDEEFRKCWALENLRPYSAKQNIKDGARNNNK